MTSSNNQRSYTMIIVAVVLALFVICAALVFLISQVPRMIERRAEQNINVKFSLVYYCYEGLNANAETDPQPPCSNWADQFPRDHPEILRQCRRMAGLNLDEMEVFSQCLDDAGAAAYLPPN